MSWKISMNVQYPALLTIIGTDAFLFSYQTAQHFWLLFWHVFVLPNELSYYDRYSGTNGFINHTTSRCGDFFAIYILDYFLSFCTPHFGQPKQDCVLQPQFLHVAAFTLDVLLCMYFNLCWKGLEQVLALRHTPSEMAMGLQCCCIGVADLCVYVHACSGPIFRHGEGMREKERSAWKYLSWTSFSCLWHRQTVISCDCLECFRELWHHIKRKKNTLIV